MKNTILAGLITASLSAEAFAANSEIKCNAEGSQSEINQTVISIRLLFQKNNLERGVIVD